jgi:hypothetical protein
MEAVSLNGSISGIPWAQVCYIEGQVLLTIQIAIGVAVGIVLARWLPTVPRRLRVRKYRRYLLSLNYYDLFAIAVAGEECIFSMDDRDRLMAMMLTKYNSKDDPIRLRDSAQWVAEDAHDRWHAWDSGKRSNLEPLLTDDDRSRCSSILFNMKSISQDIDLRKRIEESRARGATKR